MNFRMTFPLDTLSPAFQHSDQILLLGSCFAEEMGQMLAQHKYDVLQNPHGILFNPTSIVEAMNSYMDNKQYTETDLFLHEDIYHSWQHHSRFSGTDQAQVLAQINASQNAAIDRLKHIDWLVITLGSAYVYALKENNKIVGNCHKVSNQHFYKRLLTLEEVVTGLDNMMHRLFFLNKKVNILFTVSPVRYIRDGVAENNLSKAILLQAVHHLVNKFNRLHYFPAYELVIDDLRDYRFYKEDLVHPNELAIKYVWEKFSEACISPASQALQSKIADIVRAYHHRPFNPQSPGHQQFLQQYAQKVRILQQEHPNLPLAQELAYFEGR
ncbi:GSCFA family protein [Chitinophaga skermanii]|uniref:GSCFA family protein n=1 Tax=Chitinophaga skermanii TaxID=331697 RepID=A0A327QYR1_9BACT|nr:GSCFA domain-containing protein [Chitinophaga skermanii]RAJ08898.1 GSCFA family protein [Chitinophaga skermanii]